jgi:hypothetical protein
VRRKERGGIPAILLAALYVLASGLAGCAQTINATITVHHFLPDTTSMTQYAFAPLQDQATGSENAAYKNMIRQELMKFHYVESDVPNASLLVSFSYGINNGREMPQSGIFGTASYTEYRKGLWVFMYENTRDRSGDERKIVYEGSVVSAGSLVQIATVMPAMISALFEEFPGESGSMRITLIEP